MKESLTGAVAASFSRQDEFAVFLASPVRVGVGAYLVIAAALAVPISAWVTAGRGDVSDNAPATSGDC
jgi:hypothetical protein